ncbi:MAG: FAD-binding oxidoreductase [Rhodocyclaceae bacterium]|nr:FAD-binding oxidoreductase [Rhodocyclaceae bacterium]
MRSRSDFIAELSRLVGAAHVLTQPADLSPYCTDWRGRYHGEALAVVRPANTQEVAAVVAACHRAGIAIVPQGGNTGLVGGATPIGGEVVLSLTRLNRIRAIDAANHTLIAEAGCTLKQVQEAAAQAGRLFPLSLASEGTATIGGNLATNAGGVQVLRYGNARELCLGLEVVLPDGRIWNGLKGLRKDNTGYDLKHLFIGAEGTLGVITAAVLKLFAPPRSQATAWVAVPSPAAAVALLTRLREAIGGRITAFELIGQPALELVLKHIPGSRAPFSTPSPWHVLVELSDTLATDLATPLAHTLTTACEAGEALDVVLAQNARQSQALWSLRENISEAQKIEGFSIKHDISLPVSALPAFLAACDAALKQAFPGVRIVCFGHLGDGNLHYNQSMEHAHDNAELMAAQPRVNRLVHDHVARFCGSISAEHGLGQLKRTEILRYKEAVEIELMRRIKKALDPEGLMNPGKVV